MSFNPVCLISSWVGFIPASSNTPSWLVLWTLPPRSSTWRWREECGNANVKLQRAKPQNCIKTAWNWRDPEMERALSQGAAFLTTAAASPLVQMRANQIRSDEIKKLTKWNPTHPTQSDTPHKNDTDYDTTTPDVPSTKKWSGDVRSIS